MRETTMIEVMFLHRKYVVATRVKKNENKNHKIKINHTYGIFAK